MNDLLGLWAGIGVLLLVILLIAYDRSQQLRRLIEKDVDRQLKEIGAYREGWNAAMSYIRHDTDIQPIAKQLGATIRGRHYVATIEDDGVSISLLPKGADPHMPPGRHLIDGTRPTPITNEQDELDKLIAKLVEMQDIPLETAVR